MSLHIGPWWIKFQSPVYGGKRPGKNWCCINIDCDDAYGSMIRLTDDGCCKRCGKGLRRLRK